MPNFNYKARDKFSKPVSGTLSAETKEEASRKLRDMGYVPISLTQALELNRAEILRTFQRVRAEELNAFTRQLFSLQKAGLPLVSSLETIAQQTRNKYFRVSIEEIASDVKGGASFSDALEKHTRIFDSIYRGMVRAAEAGGKMIDILNRLSELIEQEIDTRQRIISATRYPLIAFGVLCLGFAIVVTFVIPRFAAVYASQSAVLPLPTRILIGINIAIQRYWYAMCLAAVAAVVFFIRFISTARGRALWDNVKLKAYVMGPLITLFIMSRFARVTALLMQSGVPILEVLHLVSRTCGNVVIARTIDAVRESVKEGKGIAEPMKVSNQFPPLVIQMVSVGEQTGKVDELLLEVADYYDRESSYMIKNLTTYIEPILIFVLAVMVLVMALAIFMPMWNLIRVFRP